MMSRSQMVSDVHSHIGHHRTTQRRKQKNRRLAIFLSLPSWGKRWSFSPGVNCTNQTIGIHRGHTFLFNMVVWNRFSWLFSLTALPHVAARCTTRLPHSDSKGRLWLGLVAPLSCWKPKHQKYYRGFIDKYTVASSWWRFFDFFDSVTLFLDKSW